MNCTRHSILLVLLLCAITSIAQVGFGPEVSVGGSNMRFVSAPVFEDAATKKHFSWRVGGILDAPFTQHIYFQSGLAIAQRGHTRMYGFYLSDSTFDSEERKLSLFYADLPLTIVFKTAEQGRGRLCLGAGATFSYLLGGTSKLHTWGKYNDTVYDRTFDSKPSDMFRRLDLGATFLAAYEFPSGWMLKATYLTGVKDLSLSSEVSKNRTLIVAVGYLFGKNRNVNKDNEGLIDKSTD